MSSLADEVYGFDEFRVVLFHYLGSPVIRIESLHVYYDKLRANE